MQLVWDMLWHPKTSIFCDTPGLSFDKTPRGYVPKIKIPPAVASNGGYKGELDPANSNVNAGDLWYVSPLNPLVTVGLVDLDSSGATLQATAGMWLAILDVPVATSAGYNVPKDPVPNSGVAAPSGSPLKGDLDGTTPKVYWFLLKSTC
jgi:hypothetical protein